MKFLVWFTLLLQRLRDQMLLNLLNVMNVESLAKEKKILHDFPEKLRLTRPEITTVQYSLCNTYGQFQD